MPNYEVIRLGGGLPVAAPEFGVLSSPVLPEGLDKKLYAVRPVRDMDWERRELLRMNDGTYRPVPWPQWVLDRLLSYCPRHYLHLSKDDPTKVAFTESREKGELDRQTTMSPGRYLQRYARRLNYSTEDPSFPIPPADGEPWLDGDEIRKLASMLVNDDALKFATTADEIEWVYEHGPESCMSGDASGFDSDIHPCRIYAAGDLAVAYIVDSEDTYEVVARCLCWPDKKIFGRLYGDFTRLEHLLTRAGYEAGRDDCYFDGARLLKIKDRHGLVAPYIDYHRHRATDAGDFLKIDSGGEIMCSNTNGYAYMGEECSECGEYYDEEDAYWVGDRCFCPNCVDSETFYCAATDERYLNDDFGADVIGVGPVCQSYLDRNCYFCDKTEEYYDENRDPSTVMANGETWSPAAVERYGGYCEKTGEYYPSDDLVTLEDTGETVAVEWARDNAFYDEGADTYYETQPDDYQEAA